MMTPAALYGSTSVRPRYRTFPQRLSTAPDGYWDALLVLVALFVATAVGRVHQLFPVLAAMRLTFVSAVLALGVYVVVQDGPRRLGLIASPTTAALLAFLCWAAASVPGALNQGQAFHMVVGDLVKSVLLYAVMVGCVRGVRDVERLCVVYFAAAAIYAAVVLTRFTVGGADWRLGDLYYYDANDFATFAVTAIPLGVFLLTTRRAVVLRGLAAVGIVVLLAGLVRSGSRGGLLALVAALGFLAVWYRAVPGRWRGAAVAAMALVVLLTASGRYWEQMQTIVQPGNDYNVTGKEGRLAIWRRGLGYVLRRPVLGVGADNFPVAEGEISPLAYRQEYGIGVPWMAPHDAFIQVAAELGVPGFALFLWLLAATLGALGHLQRAPPESPAPIGALAAALMASLAGFVVGALFLSLAYAGMLYALLALAVALRKAARLATVPGAAAG
jgi:O-antigen ligase